VEGDRPSAHNVGNKDVEQKLILESDSGEAVSSNTESEVEENTSSG
jgi:hypothetical protein